MKNSIVQLHGNSGDYPIHEDILQNRGRLLFSGSGGGIRYHQGKYRYDVFAQNYNYMEFTQGASIQSNYEQMYTQNFAGGVMVFDNGSINMTLGGFTNAGELTLRNHSTASVTTNFVNTGSITIDSNSSFNTSRLNSDNGTVVLKGGSLNIDANSAIRNLQFAGGTLNNGNAQRLTGSTGSGTLNQSTYTVNSLFTVNSGSNTGNIYANNGLTITGNVTNTGYWKIADSLAFNGNGKFNHNNGTLEIVGEDLLFTNSQVWKPELNTISMTENTPQEINTITTEYFMHFLPGDVKESLKGHLSISNGVVLVTNVNLTTTERDALTQAFKDTFGERLRLFSRAISQAFLKTMFLILPKLTNSLITMF